MAKHLFAGRHIVLTGAATGIGADVAKALLLQGARLALIDLQGDRLPHEKGILSFTADVTDRQRMQEIADELLAVWGHVDIVIAGAGVGALNPGTQFSTELDRKVMAINYSGTVNTLMPFVASMMSRRAGQLVGICSLAALRGLPMGASYSASKAAQMTFLESLRLDLRPHGVRVTCIHPGFVATPMAVHSRFPMPFTVGVKRSTRVILRSIAAKRSQVYYPWTMVLLSRLNRILPNWLYDFLLPKLSGSRKAGSKPEMFSSLSGESRKMAASARGRE